MTTASIVTLGCRLNQADSALLAGRLRRMGIELVPYTDTGADVLIVNSCAVTATASRKSRQTLRQFRAKHPDAILILTGCAANVDRNSFDVDGIDLVLGNEEKKTIEEKLEPLLEKRGIEVNPPRRFPPLAAGKVFAEHVFAEYPYKSRANLKVQEGCNNFCSYCIVPYTRGRERSRDFQETIDEFRRLLDAGFQEIAVTGINTCAYDCGGRRLPDLLEALMNIPGEFRLRLGSTEPGDILFRTLEIMAESNGKICEFLHPSLQHGSDSVLKAMNRPYTRAKYEEMIAYARSVMPSMVLTSDVIIGFPGETEDEAMQTVDLVEKTQFDALFTFIFSPRPGTPAAKMDDPVSREEKQVWFEKLVDAQNAISAKKHAAYIGRTVKVLVDGESDDEAFPLTARTEGNRLVRMKGDKALIGTFAKAKITDSNTWALYGEAVEE